MNLNSMKEILLQKCNQLDEETERITKDQSFITENIKCLSDHLNQKVNQFDSSTR